jgi:hypothetical protein
VLNLQYTDLPESMYKFPLRSDYLWSRYRIVPSCGLRVAVFPLTQTFVDVDRMNMTTATDFVL